MLDIRLRSSEKRILAEALSALKRGRAGRYRRYLAIAFGERISAVQEALNERGFVRVEDDGEEDVSLTIAGERFLEHLESDASAGDTRRN